MRGHARPLRMLPWPLTWSAQGLYRGTHGCGRPLQGGGPAWKVLSWEQVPRGARSRPEEIKVERRQPLEEESVPFPRAAGLGPHGFSLQGSVGSRSRRPWP